MTGTEAHRSRVKPSTACEPCRKKRTKCDRRRPQCSQCIRSSVTCFGYRERLDLFIRDQSRNLYHGTTKRQRTIDKGSTSSTKRFAALNTKFGHAENPVDRRSGDASLTTLPPVPKWSTKDVIVTFFVCNFGQTIYFEYCPQLYAAATCSATFKVSFEAVATVFVAKRDSRSDLMQEAIHKYSLALRSVNKALSLSETATKDETVASVMLLALFAALSGNSTDAAQAWATHIAGAMTLLDMRPSDLFQECHMQWMLAHVISSIQLDCFIRKKRFPRQLLKLYSLSVQSSNTCQTQFWDLVSALAGLREMSLRSEVDDLYMVKQAKCLDQQALKLLTAMPFGYMFEEQQRRMTSDQFPRHRILQNWNHHHVARMNLSQLIIFHGTRYMENRSEDSDCDLTLEINQASTTMAKAVEAICDNVPEHLQKRALNLCSKSDGANTWICSLLWPLAQAAALKSLLPKELNTRVQTQLYNFAQNSGIPRIKQAALEAAQGLGIRDGLHVFYLC